MGRFPTCSSPVRHGYSRKSPVRLACIRHAASVNPEPGSNSPPKMLASASELAEGLCVHIVRASSTMRLVSQASHKDAARPDASVLHLRPPTRHPLPDRTASHREPLRQPASARQPTCQGAALSSAREQKKNRPNGRAALGLERICVSAMIVFDDLQSDTLRSLTRAQFGACQHLLTEGDYRHVRA
jgi:hypothetical protein